MPAAWLNVPVPLIVPVPPPAAHRHRRVTAVAQNRRVGGTGCHRAGLSDRAGRGRRAAIGIGHRVGIRARSMAKRARAAYSPCPAASGHCHRRVTAVAQNRRVGRAGCDRAGLSDISRRRRRAAMGVRYRKGICARRTAERPRAGVRRGAAGRAHCHR